MRRLLVLLLAALSLPVLAQPVLRVQFFINGDANAYYGGTGLTNATAAINAAVADANASFAASGIAGSITVAGISIHDAVPLSASNLGRQFVPTSMDIKTADLAQANNADVIVSVTAHPFPTSSIGGSWKGDREGDAVWNTIIIDADVLADTTSLLYWLGRQMGAKNQTSGGINNETAGTAHGWWLKFGNSLADCELAKTLDTDAGVSAAFSGTCAGYVETIVTPPRLECNAQRWCDDYATIQGPKAMCSSQPCLLYTNFRGTLTTNSGGFQACLVSADRTLPPFGVFTYGPLQMTAQTGNYAFTCPNVTRLNVFSNPAITYRGQPLGTVNDNSVATINANFAAKANTHNLNRPKILRALRD